LKSLITSTLIISFLTIFSPYYSYSYLGFNDNSEEKNTNSELINKIIEPTINSISLNEVDIDIDDQDILCFENDNNKIVCFDKDDINNNDINDLNINNNIDDDLQCFETDDDEVVCFDKTATNNDDSIFLVD
jgi:hypothetical protein